MKQIRVIYCVAESETMQEFTETIAALSLKGKTVIAKFEGKVALISPFSDAKGIINTFDYLDYNANVLTLTGNL